MFLPSILSLCSDEQQAYWVPLARSKKVCARNIQHSLSLSGHPSFSFQAHPITSCPFFSQILGCYAQTEMGHGSNIQALQTTATFDAATDEFVLKTPTIHAFKWWPGTLGRTGKVRQKICLSCILIIII